jgi:hypothetical protein
VKFRRLLTQFAITLTMCGILSELAAGGACPGPNKVPHRDGTYDFTYESWIRKYPQRDHWDFGRCVENKLSTIEMYVDWKNTGVKGWAKPDDRVDSAVESPNDDYDLLKTDLWYGAAPARIDTQYREVKPRKEVPPGTVRSYVYMAVPLNPKHAAETLVSIEVEFTSTSEKIPQGFKYIYQWSDSLATDRAPIRFRWKSLSTLLSATKTPNPERMQLSTEKSAVSFVSVAPPAYDVTVVEFLDRQGETVVGTAPVATYHPSDIYVPMVPDDGKQ